MHADDEANRERYYMGIINSIIVEHERSKKEPEFNLGVSLITKEMLTRRITVVAVHELGHLCGIRDFRYSTVDDANGDLSYNYHNPNDGSEYNIHIMDNGGLKNSVVFTMPGTVGSMTGRGMWRPENYAYLQFILPLP